MRVIRFLVLCVGVCSVLLNIDLLFLREKEQPAQVVHTAFSKEEQKYPLLSKRILLEFPNDLLINFLPLRNKLRSMAGEYNAEKNTFALYFEYLPTGTSVGIKDKTEFTAVSLFKVPIIMAYYHRKERLGITKDPIVTIQAEDIDKEYGTLWQRGVGTQIKLSEAVRLAIEDSDNTAIKLVTKQIDEEDFNAVYGGLDLDLQLQNDMVVITAKQFSSLLKALYFSSILTKQDSEQILNMMTKTDFADKLPAGVPSPVPVAHKIGVLNKDMYMDCGIVYAPRRPYLLCMISVSDENTARERMKIISSEIYQFVTAAKSN